MLALGHVYPFCTQSINVVMETKGLCFQTSGSYDTVYLFFSLLGAQVEYK